MFLGACGGGPERAIREPAEPATGLVPGVAAGRNVVLVVVDTLRADRLPFHGCPRRTAPFLEELARRGVVFERVCAASSWTAPATASIRSPRPGIPTSTASSSASARSRSSWSAASGGRCAGCPRRSRP